MSTLQEVAQTIPGFWFLVLKFLGNDLSPEQVVALLFFSKLQSPLIAHSIQHLRMTRFKKVSSQRFCKILSFLPNLSSLTLNNCENVTKEIANALTACSALENIEFSNCQNLTNEFANAFTKCPVLVSANFSVCVKITDVTPRALAECPMLESVNFLCCRNLTDEAARALATCRMLKFVDFSFCRNLTNEGIRALKSSCSSCWW